MTTGAPAAEAGEREDRKFTGTSGWHVVAFIAGLVLFLAMSMDWYTTTQGEEYRSVQEQNENSDGPRLSSQDVERAARLAEAEEKNAWQADAFLDRLILLACLAAFGAAVAAALLRSIGRSPDPPWRPSALATVFGVIGLLLILYRMINPPGFDDAAVVKAGAPVALAAIGILTVGSRLATLVEREERGELRPTRRERQAREAPAEGASRRGRRASRRAAAAGAAGATPAPPGKASASPGTASRSPELSPEPPSAAPPAPPPPVAPSPADPLAPDPEPTRPGRLWAPDPAGDDPSAEERERRRLEREAARARRAALPPPDSGDREDPSP